MAEPTGRAPESEDEAQAVFLDTGPPHWAARGLAWILIALALTVVAASAVIRLPETVRSPFVLVPLQGTDPIRAAHGGVVAAVQVREGQPVAQGDSTFIIRSSAVGDRSAELQSLEAQLEGTREESRNARQKYESQRRSDAEERERLSRRTAFLAQKSQEHQAIHTVRRNKFRTDLDIQRNTIEITAKEGEFKRTQYALAAELADRLEREYKEGGISWLEYNARRLEATKLAVEQQQLQRTLETERLRLNQIRAEQETWDKEWKLGAAEIEAERSEVQSSLEKLRQSVAARDAEYRETARRLTVGASKARFRAAALRDDLNGSRGGDLSLAAPCAGTVLRLTIRAPGAVVQEGDILGELACSGERLQAEVLVPQSGIGLIKPGQQVKLLYDAFPYQRYGVKLGSVRWVSPASVLVRDQPVFRVLVEVQEMTTVVKTERRPLLAGMGGTAEIVVGKRSLLGFAFEPIRQLRESLSTPGS